jgi:diguanylate cyclase (GGDEF)-like protein/PAS domain S-box-containing protein
LAYARARRIAEFIPDGLALLDLDGMIRWVSPSLVRMSGRPASELLDRPATVLVLGADAADLAEGLAAAGDEAIHRTARAYTPDGWRWAELAWRVVSDPDEAVPDEIVLSWRDVHDQQLELLAMTALAQHDELTGLANRAGLARRLDQLASQGMAVLYVFIDLDGFKAVNDTWGHPEGDRVLAEVAAALRSVVRPDDVVARVGGDEFAVLIAPPIDPATLGDRLLGRVRTVSAGGRPVTVSVGIAGPVAAGDVRLHHLADDAMYEAKRCGKDAWAHLDSDRHLRTSVGKGA